MAYSYKCFTNPNFLSFMDLSYEHKYFIIIKKEEIITSKINFDDHKSFEETTNEFFLSLENILVIFQVVQNIEFEKLHQIC